MKVDEAAWRKWQQRIVLIQHNLQISVNDQVQFDVFREVVAHNTDWIQSNIGAEFVYLVTRSFASHVFMTIRRQVKARDKGSLVRLLTLVAMQSHQLTYQRYLTFHPLIHTIHEWQRDAFGTLSEDGLVVTRSLVDNDLATIKQLSADAEKIVDNQVAHLETKGIKANATFDQLRNCLNHFAVLTVKYIRFFTGVSHPDGLKAQLPFDPRQIFGHPFTSPADWGARDCGSSKITLPSAAPGSPGTTCRGFRRRCGTWRIQSSPWLDGGL
jgi:hypothetical protein